MTARISTKITGLTASNIDALAQAQATGLLDVELGKTIAVFPKRSDIALEQLAAARDALAVTFGTRGHPVASLPAVRRKLEKSSTVYTYPAAPTAVEGGLVHRLDRRRRTRVENVTLKRIGADPDRSAAEYNAELEKTAAELYPDLAAAWL